MQGATALGLTMRHLPRLAATLAVAVALGACSAGAPSASFSKEPGAPPRTFPDPVPDTAPVPGAILPDVLVTDVATAREVPVRSIFPASQPLLLWFWAPH